MPTLMERLAKRFEDDICRVCVHRTAGGGCTLTEHADCPVQRWAEQLAEVVKGVASDRLSEYLDHIQAVICPQCIQDEAGHCKARTHLDCPLDLYLGLVVRILEEELERDGIRGG